MAATRWCTPSPSSLFLRKPPTPTLTPIRIRIRVNALFGDWGFGNRNNNKSLSFPSSTQQFTFTLTDDTDTDPKEKVIKVSVVSSISDIPSSEWDACAVDASGADKFNPFLSHGFLSTLEHSASAVRQTGWTPHHIVAKHQNNIVAVVPLYLKTHSYGEFVFDHSWANAYHSYGYKYYPKLQSCVPFTPVTGPRILLRNTSFKDQIFDIIVSAMKDLTATVIHYSPLLFLLNQMHFIANLYLSVILFVHSPSFRHYMLLFPLKLNGTNSLKKASCPGLECSTTGKTVTTKSQPSISNLSLIFITFNSLLHFSTNSFVTNYS